MNKVDLQELAIDREPVRASRRASRHLLTRYLLPSALLAGFVALVVWAGWELMFPPTSVRVMPVIVSRAQLQREGTPLFKAAGWVEPRPTPIQVAALAPGVVEALLVVEDQEVAKGDIIAELVKEDARLMLERASAELRLREAELEQAAAALTSAETRLAQPVHLQAMVAEAQAALAHVQTDLKNLPHEIKRAESRVELAKRDIELKKKTAGAVSDLAFARAESELAIEEAQLVELRERLPSLEREQVALTSRRDAQQRQLELLAEETRARDEAKAQRNAAASRLEQARVAVDEAKLQLQRMTIRAPVSGRVHQLVANPGTMLSRDTRSTEGYDGATVVTLYQPESLQLRVDVRFEDVPHVSRAQPVEIENPGLGKSLRGRVLFTSSLVNIQKNTLEVKVAIDSPPALLKPEMLVDATFLAPPPAEKRSSEEDVSLYVPESLIQKTDGGASVWVADQSAGVARLVPITLGAQASGGLIEVAGGLNVTSRLIVSGYESLRDGARIRIAGEASQPTSEAAEAPSERTQQHEGGQH